MERGDRGVSREQAEGPPSGTGAWKDETKAIERVIDVTLTLEEPRTAGWIADESMVAEQTAREHLDLLSDLNVVTATKARGVTKYRPDTAYLRFQQVSSLVERYDRDELMEKVECIKEETESIKQEYDAERPDELRARAASDDVSAEEVRQYKKAASEWDTLRHELDIFKDALERYEDFDRASATA